MKVIILGYGGVGRVLSNLLIKDTGVARVVCADLVAPRQTLPSSKKISFVKLDFGKKKELITFLKKQEADVVVNAALPQLNELILQSCVLAKTNYLDLAAFWDADLSAKKNGSPYKIEQLDYDADFKKIGKVALINAGVSPGLTNLLAAEGVGRLDAADAVKIRLIEDTGSDALAFAWSKQWLLDEVNWKPLVYRNKKFSLAQSFSEGEVFEYPQPFGSRHAYLLAQEEVATIAQNLPVKSVDVKTYDNHIGVFQALAKLGLVSEKKIRIEGVRISPLEFLCTFLSNRTVFIGNPEFAGAVFVAVVEVTGTKNGAGARERLAAVFPTQKAIDRLKLGGNFITYPTALCAYLFVKEIPHVARRGVYAPELLEPEARTRILSELSKTGIFSPY